MTTRVEIIYWRDIPAQVIAGSGEDVHRIELPVRFQEAIDRAAQRAGATDTDAYLAEWRKERTEMSGDPAEVARDTAASTEETFTVDVLAAYALNLGWKP